METSLQNEFGEYANFREKLPDTAANIIFRKHFSTYMGLYSEWLWTNRDKVEFIQTNFGTYANNIQFGISYRLGKNSSSP